jgi:hypothetical protein
VSWKHGLAILVGLAFLATILQGMNAYSVQLTLLSLLVVIASAIIGMLSLVVFVLFQEGVRLSIHWLTNRPNGKTKIAPSIQLDDRSREAL